MPNKLTDIQLWNANRTAQITTPESLYDLAVPRFRDVLGGVSTVNITIPAASKLATATEDKSYILSQGKILRFIYDDNSISEYSITSGSREFSGQSDRTVTAETISQDLQSRTVRKTLANGHTRASVNFYRQSFSDIAGKLLSPEFNCPSYFELGSVPASFDESTYKLSLNGAYLMQAIKYLCQQAGGEWKVAYNSVTDKYQVDFYEAGELGGGKSEAQYRRMSIKPGEGNRFRMQRKDESSQFFSRIVGLSGQGNTVRTFSAARWDVKNKNGSNIKLSDSAIAKDGYGLISGKNVYFGNETQGWVKVTATQAPNSLTVATSPAGITYGYFKTGANKDDVVFLEDPEAVAEIGIKEEKYVRNDIGSFANLVESAGIDPVLNTTTGWAAIGAPSVTQETADLFSNFGEASAKVVGNKDEGLRTVDIPINPTELAPYYSMQVYLSVGAGSVRIEIEDSNGKTYPTDAVAKTNSKQTVSLSIGGEQIPQGNVNLKVICNEDKTTYYLDAITFTNSASAQPYQPLMGARALWKESGRYLKANSGDKPDIWNGEGMDNAYSDASAKEIEIGSWLNIQEDWDELSNTYGTDKTLRVVGLSYSDNRQTGRRRKRVKLASAKSDASEFFQQQYVTKSDLQQGSIDNVPNEGLYDKQEQERVNAALDDNISLAEADARYLQEALSGADIPDAAAFAENIGLGATDTPPFAQVSLNNPPTTDKNALRGGQVLNTNTPLTGGGKIRNGLRLALSYVSDNFTITGGALNTVQDIYQTARVKFKSLKFGDFVQSKVFSDYFSADPRGARIRAGDGSGDFRKLWIDELIAKAFTVDVAQALAGSDILTKSVGILAEGFIVPAAGNSTTITLEDLPGLKNFQLAEDGDWVRFKVVDRTNGLLIADVWGEISGYTNQPDGKQQWTFTTNYAGIGGAGQEIYKGAVMLDYGKSGDTYIERTVLDRSSDSDFSKVPYDRIVRWTGSDPRTGTHTVLNQRGNLNGVADYTSPEQGIFVGDSEGTALTLDLTNGFRLLDSLNVVMKLDGDRLQIGQAGQQGLYYDLSEQKMVLGNIPVDQIPDKTFVEAEAAAAVDALEIGGRNLLESSKELSLRTFSGGKVSTLVGGWARYALADLIGEAECYLGPNTFIEVTGGASYTQSVYFRTDADVAVLDFLVTFWSRNGGHTDTPAAVEDISGNLYRLHSTETLANSINEIRPLDLEIKNISTAGGTYLEFAKAKFEQSTKASAWSPAPEDILNDAQDYTDQLETYVDGAFEDGVINKAESQAIGKYLNMLAKADSAIDNRYIALSGNADFTGNIGGEYNAYETAYGNLRGSINAAVNAGKNLTQAQVNSVNSDFNAYNGALGSLEDAFEAAAANIAQNKADNAVDAIEIGGRNLVLDSGYDAVSSTSDYLFGIYELSEELKDDQTYTISLRGYVDQALRDLTGELKIVIYEVNYREVIEYLVYKTQPYTEVHTFDPLYNATYKIAVYRSPDSIGNGGRAHVDWVQLEEGNQATGWRPNPQDIENYINGAFEDAIISEAERRAIEKYKNTLATTDAAVDNGYLFLAGSPDLSSGLQTQLEQAYNAYEDAYGTLRTTINGAIADPPTKTPAEVNTAFGTYNSALGALEDAFEAAKDNIAQNKANQAVDAIEIGGRNLLLESGISTTSNEYPLQTYPLADDMPDGTLVTISLKAQLYTGGEQFEVFNSGGIHRLTSLTAADKENGIYVSTFSWVAADDNNEVWIFPIPNSGSDSTIEWIKLEYGNQATGYSPAPEDAKNELAAQLGYGSYAGMVQTVKDKGTFIIEGFLEADYIRADFFEAIAAYIGGFSIAGGSLSATGIGASLLQLIGGGDSPAIRMKNSVGDDMVIGGNYSFDDISDVTRGRTDFSPDLRASETLEDGFANSNSHTLGIQPAWEGRILSFTVDYYVAASIIPKPNESPYARASVDVLVYFTNGGSIMDSFHSSKSVTAYTGDTNASDRGQIVLSGAIPSGCDGLKVTWQIDGQNTASASRSATLDFNNPLVLVMGSQRFLSPKGLQLIGPNGNRVKLDRDKGEVLGNKLTAQGNDKWTFKEVNGQLELWKNGSFHKNIS